MASLISKVQKSNYIVLLAYQIWYKQGIKATGPTLQ